MDQARQGRRPQAGLAVAAVAVLALSGCGGDDLKNCTALRKSAPDKALEHCNTALENRLVFGERRAGALVDRSAVLTDRNDWDRAIADLSEAIQSGKLSERNLVIAQ